MPDAKIFGKTLKDHRAAIAIVKEALSVIDAAHRKKTIEGASG